MNLINEPICIVDDTGMVSVYCDNNIMCSDKKIAITGNFPHGDSRMMIIDHGMTTLNPRNDRTYTIIVKKYLVTMRCFC